MEDRVNNYLVQISENEISDQESKEVTMLLRLVTEFERIGDYAVNLMERAEVLFDRQTKFSDKAMEELTIIGAAVEEILTLAADAFHDRDNSIAIRVEPLEETIDTMEDTLKLQHIQRLKTGQCTIDAGLVFLESLTNLERISDHCSNVAVAVIGFNKGSETLNRHEYLSRVHQGDTQSYNDMMHSYMERYMKILPMDSKNIF
ncbi:MAG: Na/Pi cotransporter family protein, partial [Oscillospiraceae bacterium]|nr:Na/Pi cotransporter family protein [Oscillospiraceae bacterium]